MDGAASGYMWGGIGAGATAATAASKGIKITEIGRLKPSNKSGSGYMGVKYKIPKLNGKDTMKSLELHTPHNGHGYHWQMNKWNPYNNSISAKGTVRWTWYGRGLK